MTGVQSPPGWYPDPGGTGRQRYWDGSQWTEHYVEGFGYVRPSEAPQAEPEPTKPALRLIRSATDAEIVAAEWMRYWGFEDAVRTPTGPDGGVDIMSSRAIGQVKAHYKPIGRPDLQRLYGEAVAQQKTPLFFSLDAFTPEALDWGTKVGMALFRFDMQGEPEPVNSAARQIADGSARASDGPIGLQVDAPKRVRVFPFCCNDAVVLHTIQGQCRGVVRRDAVAWIKQVWLPLWEMRIDYTVLEGSFRKTLQQRSVGLLFESIGGNLINPPLPKAFPGPQWGNADEPRLEPWVKPDEIRSEILKTWNKYVTLKQQTAIDKYKARLASMGVPTIARGISVVRLQPIRLPIFIGLLQGASGRRMVVTEGLTGSLATTLTSVMTHRLSDIEEELEDLDVRQLL
ncbi:MAG TPA: DUF2510 domain-containing protein [Acidimicrobiales bacterium]|nr:DUF2510 domain-containing protein [Acidimicrobiales bacterium]